MSYYFQVGNDNGNSEQDIYIDGEFIRQPSVNLIVDGQDFEESDTPVASLVKDLFKNLIVSIKSPACKPRMYKVGDNCVLDSAVNYMQVGVEHKADVDLPIVNTLAIIAAFAVKKNFEKTKELKEKLEVTIDMATALPVTQWTDEAAARFQKKFMHGTHGVTVHLGVHRVDVDIKFEYVKVIPEGTPVIFALRELPKEAFAEYNKMYSEDIDGSHFADKRILHCDIGDGTTEYPITEGNRFLKQFIKGAGSDNGAGHAIEKALPEFKSRTKQFDMPRQYMEEVLKGTDPYKKKYLPIAREAIATPLENQAIQINKKVVDQMTAVKNEVDLVCCYGGGSILMKEYLFDKLKMLAEERMTRLLYIPSKYAVQLNAMGLDKFVRGDIFKGLKERALKASQTQIKGDKA